MAKVEGGFERTLSVSGPIKLIVETGSGSIRVTRGQDDRVVVKSHFVIQAPSRELAQRVAERIQADPPIAVVGRTIEIGDLSKYRDEMGFFDKWSTSIAMSFEIETPYETEAELDTGSGDQLVRAIRGPVQADAGSGGVTIEGIEREAFVDTGSGNITITGAAQVETDAGSGTVRLSDIAGDVSVDVGSGNVTLMNIGGSVTVDTGSGNVLVDSAIAEGTRWKIDTSSGNVRLKLLEDAQFRLYVETSSGQIDVEFPMAELEKRGKGELRGRVGENPSAEVYIETSSGNVEVHKRAGE